MTAFNGFAIMTDLDNLRVVLVATRNPLNIGAAARAMSNFGVRRLRVVNPYEAAFREARSAVGAAGLLANAEQYDERGRRGRGLQVGGRGRPWPEAGEICNIGCTGWMTAPEQSNGNCRRGTWHCCSARKDTGYRMGNSAIAIG